MVVCASMSDDWGCGFAGEYICEKLAATATVHSATARCLYQQTAKNVNALKSIYTLGPTDYPITSITGRCHPVFQPT